MRLSLALGDGKVPARARQLRKDLGMTDATRIMKNGVMADQLQGVVDAALMQLKHQLQNAGLRHTSDMVLV